MPVRIHAAPVFAPARIQERTRGELFMFGHEKRNINPNFWVRISSGGVGVFHVKGWGPKGSVCPSKNPRKPNFWAGYPGIFAVISRGRPKSSRNKG